MLKIRLLFIGILIYFNDYGQNVSNSKIEELNRSIKLRMLYGIFYNQYIVNPNYCISKKNEISFGIYYRHAKFDYLSGFNFFPAVATFYGLNFGYIPSIKRQKKICIRSEFNLLMSLVYTKIELTGGKKTFSPVLSGVIFWGANMKIQISKKIDFCVLYQLGIGYGTTSSSELFDIEPTYTGFIRELLPSVDLQYKLFK